PRITQLLTPRIDELAPGAARVRAHVLLAEAADVVEEHEHHLTCALTEAAEDPALRATVLARQAFFLATVRVARIHEAERLAKEALDTAADAGSEVEQGALQALAATRIIAGRPIDD